MFLGTFRTTKNLIFLQFSKITLKACLRWFWSRKLMWIRPPTNYHQNLTIFHCSPSSFVPGVRRFILAAKCRSWQPVSDDELVEFNAKQLFFVLRGLDPKKNVFRHFLGLFTLKFIKIFKYFLRTLTNLYFKRLNDAYDRL